MVNFEARILLPGVAHQSERVYAPKDDFLEVENERCGYYFMVLTPSTSMRV